MSIFEYRVTNRSDINERQTNLFISVIRKRDIVISIVINAIVFCLSSVIWLSLVPKNYNAVGTYGPIFIFLLIASVSMFFAILSSTAEAYQKVYKKYKLDFGKLSKVYPIKPKLSKFPDNKNTFQLTLGEVHDEDISEPVPLPYWLTIPEKSLFTNTFVFGAIGTGKTATVIYPALYQLLAYKPDDLNLKPALFCLDVKGEFWMEVEKAAKKLKRDKDFISLKVDQNPEWAYNTLNYPKDTNERLAEKLQEVLVMLQSGGGGGGSSDQYWNDLAKTYLINAIGLTRIYSLSIEITKDGKRDLSLLEDKRLFDKSGQVIGSYITLAQLSDILSM